MSCCRPQVNGTLRMSRQARTRGMYSAEPRSWKPKNVIARLSSKNGAVSRTNVAYPAARASLVGEMRILKRQPEIWAGPVFFFFPSSAVARYGA